jgi:hypothetical protein
MLNESKPFEKKGDKKSKQSRTLWWPIKNNAISNHWNLKVSPERQVSVASYFFMMSQEWPLPSPPLYCSSLFFFSRLIFSIWLMGWGLEIKCKYYLTIGTNSILFIAWIREEKTLDYGLFNFITPRHLVSLHYSSLICRISYSLRVNPREWYAL